MIPLHKDGSKSVENNYRPISLLNVWSKIFERLMFNRVYFYMEHFSLFYKKQFGFRKKHSTIDALIELMENVRRFGAKNTSSFFIDLKKLLILLIIQFFCSSLKTTASGVKPIIGLHPTYQIVNKG